MIGVDEPIFKAMKEKCITWCYYPVFGKDGLIIAEWKITLKDNIVL